MVRIVPDTNVIVSAYEFGGAPERVIDRAVAAEVEMYISPAIMAETVRILRDKFRWPTRELDELESLIGSYATSVTPTHALEVVKEDPTDNRILECAKAAEADYLKTGDKHLLKIKQFGLTRILKPADFLRTLEHEAASGR